MTGSYGEEQAAHEAGLGAFIDRDRRVRVVESLAAPKRRAKTISSFNHFEKHLDQRYAERIQVGSAEENRSAVLRELRSGGAPRTCWVVSDTPFDGQAVDLITALDDLMEMGAGFISCVPGELGLYVSEDGSNTFILRRARP